LGARLSVAQKDLEHLEAQLAERNAALEEARLEIGSRQKAHHDAQIEHLKALQAQERYRERSEQVRSELEQLAAETQAGELALKESAQNSERINSEIAAARERLEAMRGE